MVHVNPPMVSSVPTPLTDLPAPGPRRRPAGAPLGAGPFEFVTAEQQQEIRVSVVVRGLSHPWSLAFLPGGSMLITERPGRLRIVRHGRLDPTPIAGVPRVRTDGNGGLMDVALHPRERGRLDGAALTGVRDLMVPEAYDGNSGLNGRAVFGKDGMVYMSTGGDIKVGRTATISSSVVVTAVSAAAVDHASSAGAPMPLMSFMCNSAMSDRS